MNKKINWKNVTITMLVVRNLLLIGNMNQTFELGYEIRELKNELVSLDEETAEYYSLYKETLNELYMLQVESGYYNEYPINEIGTRNPNTR